MSDIYIELWTKVIRCDSLVWWYESELKGETMHGFDPMQLQGLFFMLNLGFLIHVSAGRIAQENFVQLLDK